MLARSDTLGTRNNSRNNRYIVLTEYNDSGNMREIPSNDKEFNHKKHIKALLLEYCEKMKADYEVQIKTYKNGKMVKTDGEITWLGFPR